MAIRTARLAARKPLHGSSSRPSDVSGTLTPPEVLEPRRGQFGIAHRMLDVAVPEIRLQSSRVMSPVGKPIAAGVPQHVRVGFEP
jgi:hypothetical protein